jgi:DNA damage-inducible protein 1
MQITFVTDIGESYALEIDPNMEMENIMALLEAEVSAQNFIRSMAVAE